MSRVFERVAALAAFIIGAMAVFAGAPVLLGRNPGWHVIGWVPYYNTAMGLISAVVTAVLLWLGRRLGRVLAVVTLAAHSAVLLWLATVQGATVASDTLRAMAFRVVVWALVVGLIVLQRRRDARHTPAPATQG